jgi:hypothetical protein
MSRKNYVENYHKNNKKNVDRIFDDLEKYLVFCVEYGINYNPSHLYKENSPYREFTKRLKGREPRNRWFEGNKKSQ